MEIKPTQNQASQRNKATSTAGNTASGAESSQTGRTTDDTVTVTSRAAELLRLEASLSAVPEVDSDKVKAIKASVEDGTYQIDTESLVDNLLNSQNEL